MNDITVTQRQLNYLEDVVYNRNLYYTPSVLAKHINKVAWKFDGNYEGVNIWNNNIYNAGEATWSYDQTNEAIKGYRASDYINNAEYQFGHLIDSDVYTKFRIRAKSVLGGINIKFRYSDDSVDAFWSIDDWNPAAFDEIEVTIPAEKLIKGIIFNSSSDISGAEWYIEWMKIYEIDSLARDINIFHTGDYLSTAGGFTGMQGNVGVGMKNPASMSGFGKILHIQGTDDASLRLQGSGGSWEIGINTANALQFYRSASDLAMVIDNTSNVGINNPDPSYGFDANCTGRFVNAFYLDSTIGTTNYTSETTGWQGNYAGEFDFRSIYADEITLGTGVTVDTIETTLTDDDTHLPTSGAVYDAIQTVDSFIELIDTPANYTGAGGFMVMVDSTPDALEFIDPSGYNLSNFNDDLSYQSPITPAALTRTNDTNITLTLGGTPATALLQATSLTLGWTGTLADGRIASATDWNTAYGWGDHAGLYEPVLGNPTINGQILSSTTAGERSWITYVTGGNSFYQSFTSQTSVTVTHNFDAYPVIDIIDNTGKVIIPLSITHNNVNSFTVTFSGVTSGVIVATYGTGETGATGEGVIVGGTANQVLAKIDGTDYNTQWVDQSGGAGGMTVSVITEATNAVKDYIYILSGEAAIPLTLPAAPSAGDALKVVNLTGLTTCVVARNGLNIMGLAEDLTLDKLNAGFELVYSDAAIGWTIL